MTAEVSCQLLLLYLESVQKAKIVVAVCDILLRTYLYSSGHGDPVVSSRHISYLDIYHNIIAVRAYI